jgi:hypothetical protein
LLIGWGFFSLVDYSFAFFFLFIWCILNNLSYLINLTTHVIRLIIISGLSCLSWLNGNNLICGGIVGKMCYSPLEDVPVVQVRMRVERQIDLL